MKERDYKNLANFERGLIEVLDDIAIGIFANAEATQDLVVEVRKLRAIFKPKAQSATLTIGDIMPATLLVGTTATAQWKEWSGPNGSGDNLPAAGAVTFTSSDPSTVTVDPSSGLVTAVAMSSSPVTISGVDAANNLTASDTVTTSETAQSATLTVVPN